MELNDLKRSWSALDRQLQKEHVVDEKQIAELITRYQAGVAKGINSLTGLQKMSLIKGGGLIALLLVALAVDMVFFHVIRLTAKEIAMGVFVLLSIMGGFWWDWRTYNFSRRIKVAEAPTVKIIEQVNEFRRKTRYEMIIISIWIPLFLGLYYWVTDYYTQPLLSQLVFIVVFLAVVGTILYFMYKKLIYKYLEDIDKNLKELKELE
jgi:hypothetical protein